MTSKNISPQVWLSERPLLPGERLYLIVSAASDAGAIQAFYRQKMAPDLLPIWSGTPYADWQPVMPYLAELPSTAKALEWIAQTDAQDWGWLAVSAYAPEVVLEHLRSLTQVRMPDGTSVFFRFWDGRHFYPILQELGAAAGQILPVFNRYLINGQALQMTPQAVLPAKPWPWWDVPPALLDSLLAQDLGTVIDNLLQQLLEEHAALYFAFPPANLRDKITRFVTRTARPEKNYSGLLKAHLENELAA